MFTLPDLPYAYNALEPYIDEQTMLIHHDGHHATYVKNLNDALADQKQFLEMPVGELLTKLTDVPVDIRAKVKNNAGGHANHSFFWAHFAPLSGASRAKPEGDVAQAINKYFGDFAQFKDKFSKAALSVFGSGWAWLARDGEDLAIMTTSNQDSPLSENKIPLLGLDVWEHAYYLKYHNRRVDYIDAWWNVISWEKVVDNLK